MARRLRKHYAVIHLVTQFGQDLCTLKGSERLLARSPYAEAIRDAVGIVALFGQCMLRRKAGLQNLHNCLNDLFERGRLQSANLRHHQAVTGCE